MPGEPVTSNNVTPNSDLRARQLRRMMERILKLCDDDESSEDTVGLIKVVVEAALDVDNEFRPVLSEEPGSYAASQEKAHHG